MAVDQHVFLGFDIRLHAKAYLAKYWDQDRRRIHLIIEDTPWPLSVDTDVWPSGIKPADKSATRRGDSDYWGETVGLWQSLGAATRMAEEAGLAPDIQAPIAIFFSYRDRVDPYTSAVDVLVNDNNTVELPEGWTLAGYDVADTFMLSGLTNCGYEEDEKQALNLSFGVLLNRYGLFGSLEHAIEFKLVSDQRVEEHAPFYVYSIYWRAPA